VQVDLPPVDANLPRAPDFVGHVRRRHRAEQTAGRPGRLLEPQHRLGQRLGDRLRLFDGPSLLAGTDLVALLDLGHLGRRGALREAPGDEEVARVPVGDADHVAAQAELLDVLDEDDLHQPVEYGRSAISRARLIATASCRWCLRQAPVTRRERILPFSDTYRRKCAPFL
jgi:hypothetical protein